MGHSAIESLIHDKGSRLKIAQKQKRRNRIFSFRHLRNQKLSLLTAILEALILGIQLHAPDSLRYRKTASLRRLRTAGQRTQIIDGDIMHRIPQIQVNGRGIRGIAVQRKRDLLKSPVRRQNRHVHSITQRKKHTEHHRKNHASFHTAHPLRRFSFLFGILIIFFLRRAGNVYVCGEVSEGIVALLFSGLPVNSYIAAGRRKDLQ